MVKEGSLGRPVHKGADARYTRLSSSGQSRKASQALQNCLLDKVGVRAWWERAESPPALWCQGKPPRGHDASPEPGDSL